MKTHYATVDRANESNMYDDWGATYCGIDYTESELTNERKHVTCKNCLKVLNRVMRERTPNPQKR